MTNLEKQMNMAKSNNMMEQLELAGRSDLLPEVVDYLVDNDRFWMAFSTIEKGNSNIFPETLHKAAMNEIDEIGLFTVLVHLNTPVKTLELSEWLENDYAILAIASNPNTPKELLDRLADSESIEVQKSVYTNLNTTKETRKKIRSQNAWYAFIGAKSYYKLKKIKIATKGN